MFYGLFTHLLSRWNFILVEMVIVELFISWKFLTSFEKSWTKAGKIALENENMDITLWINGLMGGAWNYQYFSRSICGQTLTWAKIPGARKYIFQPVFEKDRYLISNPEIWKPVSRKISQFSNVLFLLLQLRNNWQYKSGKRCKWVCYGVNKWRLC